MKQLLPLFILVSVLFGCAENEPIPFNSELVGENCDDEVDQLAFYLPPSAAKGIVEADRSTTVGTTVGGAPSLASNTPDHQSVEFADASRCYEMTSGTTLRTTFDNWDKGDWQILWGYPDDVFIDVDTCVPGQFHEAVRTTIQSLRASAGLPIRVDTYANQVLHVRGM